VTLVDLDEARNRVTIGVEDESSTRAVEQALPPLDIPREAVAILVTGQIRPLDSRQPQSLTGDFEELKCVAASAARGESSS